MFLYLLLIFASYSISLAYSASVRWTLSNKTMSTGRAQMAYGYNSSLIWLLGGLQSDYLWSRDEFTFNPSTEKWNFLAGHFSPELFECYAQCSAQFERLKSEIDFRIFIMGPIQQKQHGDNGWIYYPYNDLFNTIDFDHFPDEAEWPCSVADNTHFDNSQIVYIIGGIGEYDSKTWPIADILGYNLTNGTNHWIQRNLSRMNTPRYAGSCILVNDSIYYFGGDNGSDVVDSIEKYDILNNKWITLDTTLNIKRTGHRNVYVPQNNAILIIGGITDIIESVSSVEYFDLNTEKIVKENESNMNFKRAGVAAITWNDGRVYVFGGTLNGSYVHDTYEIGVIM